MTRDLALFMLNKGSNGKEILKILDALTEEETQDNQPQPTLDQIDF